MNEVDNTYHTIQDPEWEDTTGSATLSDNDLEDILEENGFPSTENNTTSQETEGTDEEEIIPMEVCNDEEVPVAPPTSEEKVRIKPNSPTLLVDESTSRFSGTEWYNEIQKASIIIAGQGGIGSNLSFQLARMIPKKMTLYDDDIVELVNMAGQLFKTSNIGQAKVNAIANMIYEYTSMRQVYAIKAKFTETTETGDIMMCGFDNMSARRTFFNSWVHHVNAKEEKDRDKCLFMDGRLSIDTLQVLCITGNDAYNIERYRNEFLFLDSQADSTICSMKQTTYMACMIASIMVNLFTNFIANSLDPVIPYHLPFFTEYDAQNMLFKTES